MKQYSELDVLSAIKAVTNGQSVRRAALEWGVPRMTLVHRLEGTQPHRQAAEEQ